MKYVLLDRVIDTELYYYDRLNNIVCLVIGPVLDDGAACIVERFEHDLTDDYHLTEWGVLIEIEGRDFVTEQQLIQPGDE